jgi:multidrug efflux pump subunit AcrA (membrane-fusion protein)
VPAVVVTAAVALVAIGGTYAANGAAGGGPAAALTTAKVTRSSIESTLTLTGTVTRVAQATAAFPVSGTVTAVSVRVGDRVSTGQLLATIDPTALQQSVLDAQSQLDQARAQLATDLAAAAAASAASATSSASGASRSSGAGSGTAATTSPQRSGSANTGPTDPAQQALAAVAAAQQAADRACAPVLGGTPPASTARPSTANTPPSTSTSTSTTSTSSTSTSTSSTSTSTSSSSTTSTATGTGSPSATPEEIAACLDALRAVSTAEQRAGSSLRSWSQELQAQALAQARASTSGSTAASRSGSTSGAAAGGGSAGVSQSRLITDQAGVTSAEAALAKAQDNLAAAALVAPMDGTVGAIAWAVGDAAGPSSGIQIIGSGASKVTVQVPQASLATVHVGQATHVTVPGLPPVDGKVAAVSLLPTTSSTSATPTYAADVLVTGLPEALGTGGRATVSIVVQRVDGVLAVPASAVTAVSTGVGSVGVVKDGLSARVSVQTGAMGGGLVEVVSGLALGDVVVIGDASQPLPTNGGFPGVGGGLTGIGGIGGNVRVPGGGGGFPGGGAPPGR